tara:strand:+ start:343 stop:582 length:240 start_codon:yes stop_codon:yes gene_type:complete
MSQVQVLPAGPPAVAQLVRAGVFQTLAAATFAIGEHFWKAVVANAVWDYIHHEEGPVGKSASVSRKRSGEIGFKSRKDL